MNESGLLPRLQASTCVSYFRVFYSSLQFLVFTSENYTKTVIRLRLSDYQQ